MNELTLPQITALETLLRHAQEVELQEYNEFYVKDDVEKKLTLEDEKKVHATIDELLNLLNHGELR